ncbi:Na+/H+ antiporter subunit E [Terasakiispira papahanaumokuakeensis]|uniref:Na+/H+ antiporter subunit E n=1 Tax=Terasakiispira papahanaumokuakeensis TaxID=197479 RepID=A0A1E2V651_9GAMM|nr:Na+/H+ antiporter subunit E [Terasakiispira papahanaumokuakeensis]ODC02488.1 Na+/H+ antiporter subunit E [Terasakiispira papahanaumokuakeensis]
MIPSSRLFPTPVLSLLLWALWILLQNGFSIGHAILGAFLATVIPLATYRFWNRQPDIQRPGKLLRYMVIVAWDILLANIEVAKLILGPQRKLKPAFIEVPLDLVGDFPITILASTITLTPGTVSANVSEDRRHLLLHCLRVEDEKALIQEIKTRYEAPLKEIFQC